jgi:hypothetical protein
MQVIEGGGDWRGGYTRVRVAKTSVPLNVVLAAVIGYLLAGDATMERQTTASLKIDQVGVQRRCAGLSDIPAEFPFTRLTSQASHKGC